jgi:hypothetical protein
MAVFWDYAPCRLVDSDQCFKGAYRNKSPDDGSSRHLLNARQYLPDYMTQHPRTQTSSYPLPCKPEVITSQKYNSISALVYNETYYWIPELS